MKLSRSTGFLYALTACLFAPAVGFAQDAPAAPATQPAAAAAPVLPAPPPPPHLITGVVSVEMDTAYFKRGFLQENKEAIVQPLFDISINPFHSDTCPLTDFSFNGGGRASFQMADSHANQGPRAMYEGDMFLGVSASMFHRWKADMTYVDITSPNNGFPTIQEFDWQLTFQDDGLLGPFSFHPFLGVVREIGQSAAGGPEGTYGEIGIEPAFMTHSFPVRISLPTRVGLSLGNYYKLEGPFGLTKDETYGFAETGITAMMPLPILPHDFGMVFLSTGVDFLFLDHNLQLVNHGHDDAVIGRVAIIWTF